MCYSNYVSFEIAKLAKECGFSEGSNNSYCEMQDDFIYDGDPNHPESHKKGEIRIYSFYNINKENEEHTYEIPTYGKLIDWLAIEHNLLVSPTVNAEKSISIKIIDIKKKIIIGSINNINGLISNGIKDGVKYMLNIIKEKNANISNVYC